MRLKTPIVNVIWENPQFGSIVWKQDKKFGRHFGTDFTNPDFVKLADAFGMPAWRCEAVEDFGRHLRHALSLDAPEPDRGPDRLLARRVDLRGARNGDGGGMTQHRSGPSVDAVPTQLFIGGEWRDASGGATLDVEDPSTGETIASVADATPEDAKAALDACVRRAGRVGGAPAARARRDPAARVRDDDRARRRARAADDARDGQAAGRVQGRDHLRRRSSSAGSPRRRCASRAASATAPNGVGRLITMKQPSARATRSRRGTSRWRWARARSARRSPPAARWSIKPAQQTPLSMLALAEILEEAGLPGRRAQRHHVELVVGRLEADHLRPAAAQADLHGLDRGRASKLVEQSAEDLLRTSMELGGNAPFLVFAGRRHRRRGRGRDDRQDAQHRRGVHRGQPLPRRRLGRRRVRGEAGRASWAR